MPHYHYLIVGGGMMADAAIRGILDGYGSIGLVGAETERPGLRPPPALTEWSEARADSPPKRDLHYMAIREEISILR